MVEKDLIASVCNRLNDVIIGYMEKASKFRDTVIIRVDCKHKPLVEVTIVLSACSRYFKF